MRGTIAQLRDSTPIRALTMPEALHVAEAQASKLVGLLGLTEPPFQTALIEELPRIVVERTYPFPVSGASHWADGRWLIVLKSSEPLVRQRFTLMHEVKHILDHPFIDRLYPEAYEVSSADRAEQVCDFFAAAVLMPRAWVKRVWGNGTQDPAQLARLFNVSKQAMERRLESIGLTQRSQRCAVA